MKFWLRAAALVAASCPVIAAAPPVGYHIGPATKGPDGGWDLTSVDPVAHRLYIARSEGVMALDLRTGTVVGNLVPSQRGHAAFAIPGSAEVLSTNGATNSAMIFDGRTGTIRATIATGKKPDAVAYDPLTRTAWIMNADGGDITVVNVRSGKAVATVTVGGALELGAVDGEGHLFVNIEDRNEVAVIDTRQRRLVRRFALPGCLGPTGLAFAADAKYLISACANGVATVSTPEGRQIARLLIGPGPDGALYDERRHVALIPSGGDGTLAVIRLRPAPVVVQRLPTARGARTAALDPSTGRLYLSAADYMPAVEGQRPKMIPGSYRVIEVDPSR